MAGLHSFDKKEFYSIPNLLSYLRLILIPVFCVLYLRADSQKDYYLAIGVLAVSSVSDFLDGQIARRCNMITNLGKILDPVADKLTHLAIAFCLMFRYPLMIWLFVLMLIKEGYMAVMGLYTMQKGKEVEGAKLYGKFCTATLFVLLLALVIFVNIPLHAANILIIIEMCIMLFALIAYIRDYHIWLKQNKAN